MRKSGIISAETGRYALDSFALLAFLQGEAGMERVKEVLDASERDECRVFLSWINLGEVMYIVEREKGLKLARDVLARVQDLPIQLVEASPQVVLEAVHIKANHPIADADAFAAAVALRENAVVLTGDPEFNEVEGMVQVEWLKR
jgi:predicted nucleic acid-binding protein